METFFQSVSQAFSGNRRHLPLVEALLLALLALVLLLQLAGAARRLLARRSGFRRVMADHGLSAEDVRFTAGLAALAGVEPLLLVTHLDLFERATAQALAHGAAAGPAAGDSAGRIRRVRHALGYDRLPPHTPLLTTRELAPGMALDVGSQPGTVTEVDEGGFTVELRQPPELPAGPALPLTLTHAREARYALGCRLVEARPAPGGAWLLRFEHDEHPVRQQQRDHARVRIEGALALVPVTRWQGRPELASAVLASLVDLSGGGALATSRTALPVGTLVLADFTVGGDRFEGLRAVVLSCQPAGDRRHQLHLEFTGRPGVERERLVAALTRLERGALAAGRA